MKKYVLIVFAATILFSRLICNAQQSNLNSNNKIAINDTVKSNKINVVDKKLYPDFYLKIFKVYCGATWFDKNSGVDKMLRIVLYNDEEHISIIVETIIIKGEGGPLILLKQEKLSEEKLKMNEYSISSVEFIEWVNAKEVKLKINHNCFIVNLENLAFKKCQ
jgi:hypothetical protein